MSRNGLVPAVGHPQVPIVWVRKPRLPMSQVTCLGCGAGSAPELLSPILCGLFRL